MSRLSTALPMALTRVGATARPPAAASEANAAHPRAVPLGLALGACLGLLTVLAVLTA